MKEKIKNMIIKHRKWLSIPLYTIIALIAYTIRIPLIYPHLRNRLNINNNIYDIIFYILAVSIFIGIAWLCTSPKRRRDFKDTCEAIGLHDAKGRYPRLISVCNDPHEHKGKIYSVLNYGIGIDIMDEKLNEAATDYAVRWLEYAHKTKLTELHIKDRKYITTIISNTDSAVGRLDIKDITNLLICGSTGSGKTVATKIIMEKFVQSCPNAKIWVMDFKAYDFKAFKSAERYYSYLDCEQGLIDYYTAFKEQQKRGIAGEKNILIFDEWASFILSLDKKKAELFKKYLSEILMLGRSYNFIPIIGQQTAMAELYSAGARSNFKMILCMGNISKEQKNMLFSNYKEQITENTPTGMGHLLIDGQPYLERVKFVAKNFNKLDENIIRALQQ